MNCEFCGASVREEPALIDMDGEVYCASCLMLAHPRIWLQLGGDSGLLGIYHIKTEVVAE